VVSDEPLSKETNYRTEFVAVLSNQPQGGFITRKPSPPPSDLMASGGDGLFGFFTPRSDGGVPVRSNGFGGFFQPNGDPAAAPQSGQTATRGGRPIYPSAQRGQPVQQDQPAQQGWGRPPGW
jgi:hypothetical protein